MTVRGTTVTATRAATVQESRLSTAETSGAASRASSPSAAAGTASISALRAVPRSTGTSTAPAMNTKAGLSRTSAIALLRLAVVVLVATQ